jgi:phosphomannomutase
MRMNAAVVTRAAAGLAAYLREHDAGLVVVGYDARHKSDLFARVTAQVMVGAGLRAVVLPRPLPTPVTAHTIHQLAADAAVMVTASHNPPADNGYKVYVGSTQIVPPVDAEISAAIDAVGSLADVPLADDGWLTLDDGVLDAYVERVLSLVAPGGPRDLRIAYTPLHGVGGSVLERVLAAAGFDAVRVVGTQAKPDPDFPTVAFPNPEEPGAMDAALALASVSGADLVIANDPDADRCAIGIPSGDGFRMLRGDEVGVLLAAHLLHRGLVSGRDTFATTIVSSSMLGAIARAHDIPYVETLTGFKWLARVPNLRYAYEEALGYCVDPAAVTDKDGISAALLVAEMAAVEKADGRSLQDVLDDLARRYGVHATDQLSVRVADLNLIEDAMQRLRGSPPTKLGGHAVLAIDDLATGSEDLPSTDALRLRLADGARVVVRPSGTEPKLKCYLETVVQVSDGDVAPAREVAAERLTAIKSDLAAALGIDVT